MTRRPTKEQARPWLAEPEDPPEETEPMYLSTGERIDLEAPWVMPGQEKEGEQQ